MIRGLPSTAGSSRLALVAEATSKNLQVDMRIQVVPHQISAYKLALKFKPL